ncbi:MAG: glycosyltransferase family 1 protein [Candidatus Saccharibacteria bacterium]|nr:glycosyltransferase family 1 protein [Candidatus Saccharibacteria bacterium]
MTKNDLEKSQEIHKKHIVIDARIRRASTGRYVDRLVEHLQDIDQQNRYSILINPEDTWKPRAENFEAVPCPYAQFSLNPGEQFGFARQLKNLKADLVHFTLNQQPLLYRGKRVTSTLDLTMLRFTRAGKTPVPIFWIKMLGYRFLFWYSNKKSEAIITISNYVKDDLARHYSFTKGKTTSTYCASEPPLPGKPKSPQYIDSKTPFLLYVGTAFPHKNLTAVIDALPALQIDHPKLKLVLVGKKEQYYEKIDQYIQDRNYEDSVITTGYIEDSELKWLYQHCVAYVFPSLSEGFGLPGLEAMVHGAPVVSSNATCLPEVYGDAALYFNPKDSDDIVQKISRILTDTEFRTLLIARGHKQAATYSWRRMAEQTLEVYTKVLNS